MADTGNGNGESRLDRIEKIMERHATMVVDADIRHQAAMERMDRIERANEAAHDDFKAGFKSLLSSQVLMNAAMERMSEEFDSRMVRLETKMEETTDKLNGLIATVDGFIRRPNA